jgi:hypothetical protein
LRGGFGGAFFGGRGLAFGLGLLRTSFLGDVFRRFGASRLGLERGFGLGFVFGRAVGLGETVFFLCFLSTFRLG